MELIIEIISGPDQGNRITVTPGLKIGRKKGDILLKDPKVSSLHAAFEKDDQGRWLAIDQNSVNGLRVDGRRFTSLVLTQDLIFQIGNTKIQVIQSPTPEALANAPKIIAQPPPKNWRDYLSDWFADHASGLKKVKPLKDNVRAFKSAIELEFVAGPQLDTRWTIGFGPRKFGGQSLEFPIWEDAAPPTCFLLIPNSDGLCVMKTDESSVVLLNDQPVNEGILQVGDTITIYHTKLHVNAAPA